MNRTLEMHAPHASGQSVANYCGYIYPPRFVNLNDSQISYKNNTWKGQNIIVYYSVGQGTGWL